MIKAPIFEPAHFKFETWESNFEDDISKLQPREPWCDCYIQDIASTCVYGVFTWNFRSHCPFSAHYHQESILYFFFWSTHHSCKKNVSHLAKGSVLTERLFIGLFWLLKICAIDSESYTFFAFICQCRSKKKDWKLDLLLVDSFNSEVIM